LGLLDNTYKLMYGVSHFPPSERVYFMHWEGQFGRSRLDWNCWYTKLAQSFIQYRAANGFNYLHELSLSHGPHASQAYRPRRLK